MPLKTIVIFSFLLIDCIVFSQTIAFNSGVLKSLINDYSQASNEMLYKEKDVFFDVRYIQLKKNKKRSYFCFGLNNRSDNYSIVVYNKPIVLYPKTTINYTNRLTTIYGGLRWQFPILKSQFWFGNELDFGVNWYRIENKQYLHPHDNEYTQTGTGPYFLEVIHKSHLKMNIRYELILGYQINTKLSVNFNCSLQLPTETNYKITTNTSLYGDYFENFFTSSDYFSVKRNFNMNYQIGLGFHYNFLKK
jgi:hypothetical protein